MQRNSDEYAEFRTRIAMNILVTGATGFIGSHVVSALLRNGHEVTAVARNADRAGTLPWVKDVNFIACDIHQFSGDAASVLGLPDALIHLAWADLSNYRSLDHIEKTLPADYRFLKSLVLSGVRQIAVAGTCFEYGMRDGCLSEDMPTLPVIPYAIAKDSLRRFLQALRKTFPFCLQWARLFYLYGEGQRSGSLIAQLNEAIDRGDSSFPMSGGEQLRDYLPVEVAAAGLASLAETPSFDGIVNICSGAPISVRRLAEGYIAMRNASISLDLGYYPYPEHEPMAFWGSTEKLNALKNRTAGTGI